MGEVIQEWPFGSPRRSPHVWATIISLLVHVGCGPLPVNLSEQPQSFLSKDYERIFERWTREKEVYNLDTLDNSLTVSATFRSWQFRQAFVERYADDYRLSDAQKAGLVEEQRLEYEASNEFIVATTASKRKWADLARDDSPWVIALANDRGQEVAAASIEKISKPSPEIETYYPFINVYRKTFLIRFPKTLGDGSAILSGQIGSFSLIFSGALGMAELTWKVEG